MGISSGRPEYKQRSGKKPNKLSEEQIESLCNELEIDNQMTLSQLSLKAFELFG